MSKGPGDPDRIRLARRQADACEEASRIAEVLAALMRRALLPDTNAVTIAKDVRLKAVAFREAAAGRLESRLTTKNTGHPLLEGRRLKGLFLDESGTAVMGSPEDVFSLGGVAMNAEDIEAYKQAADLLKTRFFGHVNVTFHEPMMRKHRGLFNFRGDTAKQNAFSAEHRSLVASTPFTVFGAAIRKTEFKRLFVETAADPYLPNQIYDLAIMLVMERFVDHLAYDPDRRLGRVHLESIGARPDAEHQAAYGDLMLHGTQYVPENTFQSWLEAGCRFVPKSGSGVGELADLVARELYEWAMSDCKVTPPYWGILSTKCYCRGDGHYGRFGLKVFPECGVSEAVYAHREACGATPRTN